MQTENAFKLVGGVWRRHPEFVDYEISNFGQVRRATPKRGTRVGKMLKPSRMKSGYQAVSIGGGTKVLSHLVLETFIGPRPKGSVARHLDDCKDNYSLANLAWGSHAQNYLDRVRNDGGNHGERHGCAKLTSMEVQKIRLMADAGIKQRQIAEKFSTSRSNIGLIVGRTRWNSTLAV